VTIPASDFPDSVSVITPAESTVHPRIQKFRIAKKRIRVFFKNALFPLYGMRFWEDDFLKRVMILIFPPALN
jgi:hypothetical protein